MNSAVGAVLLNLKGGIRAWTIGSTGNAVIRMIPTIAHRRKDSGSLAAMAHLAVSSTGSTARQTFQDFAMSYVALDAAKHGDGQLV